MNKTVLKSNTFTIPKLNKNMDIEELNVPAFHEEFLSNYEEFSLSWRKEA
jgi:hypothetical protein